MSSNFEALFEVLTKFDTNFSHFEWSKVNKIKHRVTLCSKKTYFQAKSCKPPNLKLYYSHFSRIKWYFTKVDKRLQPWIAFDAHKQSAMVKKWYQPILSILLMNDFCLVSFLDFELYFHIVIWVCLNWNLHSKLKKIQHRSYLIAVLSSWMLESVYQV